MSARVSLRGMIWLMRVDTLNSDHNVGFLAGRLINANESIKQVTSLELHLLETNNEAVRKKCCSLCKNLIFEESTFSFYAAVFHSI